MNTSKAVILWVASLCLMVILMVVVGGVTRLTGSGLSIVEWAPIMGAIPPLNQEQWLEAFGKYQQFPQYQLQNSSMSLEQFKFIFLWEYFHRLLGRLMGVVFLVPWLYFIVTKKIDRRLALRTLWGFILGGLQGALGWFMVKSGLIDMPRVSHYRLAAHLSLALFTLAYLFWIYLDLTRPRDRNEAHRGWPVWLWSFTALVSVQIVYGAFVAGLHAGHAYNTFPLMMGHLIPPDAFAATPAWLNFLETPAAVQFVHRTLGWLILASAIMLFIRSRSLHADSRLRKAMQVVFAIVIAQFTLGVSTLLLSVPISLASVHQLGGTLLLISALWANHILRRA